MSAMNGKRLSPFFRILRILCAFLFAASASLFATSALAAIPAAERQVLIDLYNSTNGDGWTNNSGWKTAGSFSAVGTECSWYGVICDAKQTHTTMIHLYDNTLTGPLPSTLNTLTALQVVYLRNNQLTGSIPDLTGLTGLRGFEVSYNRLTGSIPNLTGLTELGNFDVSYNQLSGGIPDLTGLTGLGGFRANNNRLTGNIPDLAGLTGLGSFDVSYNQLSGGIPDLTGLTKLEAFDVSYNQLTGGIPSLTGLMRLNQFYINNNQLTGAPPAPPASLLETLFCQPLLPCPSSLATLCPNYLVPSVDQTINTAWGTATGEKPWYKNCTAALPGPTREYTGQWFKVDEDAWGLSVFQNFPGKPRYLFVPWFTYDKFGRASWYVFQGDNWTADDTLSADVYRYTGPNWGTMPYDNSKVTNTKVGTAKLTFTSAITARFEYNVEGSSRSIDLQKLE